MHDKSLEESIRSRLALGQAVWLVELASARLVTVSVHKGDLLMDLIFTLGAQLPSSTWKFEITDRARSTRVETIDDVLAYLDRHGSVFELRD